MEGGAVGHNFERDTPRDHLCHVWTLHRCFLPNLLVHILIFSETTWPNGTKLGSKHLCKVLYKVFPFCSIRPTNMAAKIAVGHNFERDTPRDHLCHVWTLHRCFLPNLAPFARCEVLPSLGVHRPSVNLFIF
jgi:hypothetical protein